MLSMTMSESWQLSPPGPAKRYRMKAIQTSKSCNIICMYTAFSATDSSSSTSTSKGLKDPPQPLSSGSTGIHRDSYWKSYPKTITTKCNYLQCMCIIMRFGCHFDHLKNYIKCPVYCILYLYCHFIYCHWIFG